MFFFASGLSLCFGVHLFGCVCERECVCVCVYVCEFPVFICFYVYIIVQHISGRDVFFLV